MKHFLKLDPHAGTGSYMIRSLYFDDYWNSAFEEKEAGVLMRKNTVSGSMIAANGRSDWNGRKNSEALFIKKVPSYKRRSLENIGWRLWIFVEKSLPSLPRILCGVCQQSDAAAHDRGL
ncbi:MAG: hypothetical protein ACLR6B_15340 [Blautia sp.]